MAGRCCHLAPSFLCADTEDYEVHATKERWGSCVYIRTRLLTGYIPLTTTYVKGLGYMQQPCWPHSLPWEVNAHIVYVCLSICRLLSVWKHWTVYWRNSQTMFTLHWYASECFYGLAFLPSHSHGIAISLNGKMTSKMIWITVTAQESWWLTDWNTDFPPERLITYPTCARVHLRCWVFRSGHFW